MTIKVHTDTFGITAKALKALRDELAERIDHKIEVWELEAGERDHVEGYGLVIYDFTKGEVVVIGDGFRGDGGGEGGAGHRAAQALLAIYGIGPFRYDQAVLFDADSDWAFLLEHLGSEVDQEERKMPMLTLRDHRPHYINHVLRKG